MKKTITLALAVCTALPSLAKTAATDSIPKDSLVFTTLIQNPVTSIKNQNNSGTCWSYSAFAFLESEVLKKNPKLTDVDLCESFLVSKTYTDRADRHVRTHGDASFSQGGSFYDAIYCMENYGLVPEGVMPYPITPYGDSLFNFTSFFPPHGGLRERHRQGQCQEDQPHLEEGCAGHAGQLLRCLPHGV